MHRMQYILNFLLNYYYFFKQLPGRKSMPAVFYIIICNSFSCGFLFVVFVLGVGVCFLFVCFKIKHLINPCNLNTFCLNSMC